MKPYGLQLYGFSKGLKLKGPLDETLSLYLECDETHRMTDTGTREKDQRMGENEKDYKETQSTHLHAAVTRS